MALFGVEYLRLPSTQQHILDRITSSVQPALNVNVLAELPVRLPPAAVQPSLGHLVLIAEEQYRAAVHAASLRRTDALDILAEYMELPDAP